MEKELHDLMEEIRKLEEKIDRIDLAVVGDEKRGTHGIVHRLDELRKRMVETDNKYDKRVSKIEMAGILVGFFLFIALAEKAWPLLMKIFT